MKTILRLCKRSKSMSLLLQTIMVATALMFSLSSYAQNVEFQDPDFKSHLLSMYPSIDSDRNGEIQISEAEAFSGTIQIVGNQAIESLNGIGSFTNLTELSCRNLGSLTSLDLSRNTALTRLTCENTRLKNLELSQNTDLIYLNFSGNDSLKNLDLSGNTSLTHLTCFNTLLKSLELSQNAALTYLNCSYNDSLKSLDLRQNTNLGDLNCSNNSILSSLYISTNNLDLTVDADHNPMLFCIVVDDVSVAKQHSWEKDSHTNYCSEPDQHLVEMELSQDMLDFREIDRYGDYLDTVFIKNTGPLNLRIDTISLSGNPAGQYNIMESFSFPQFIMPNDSLEVKMAFVPTNTGEKSAILNIETNHLESPRTINLIGEDIVVRIPDQYLRGHLERRNTIDINRNDRIELSEARKFTGSITLKYRYGRFTNQVVTDFTGMEEFINLTGLRIEGFWEREEGLPALDLSVYTDLTRLICDSNNIDTLNLTKNVNLTLLNCSDNRLDTLDLRNNVNLTELYCSNNQLTGSLDLRNNIHLDSLDTRGNPDLGCIIVNDLDSIPTMGWHKDPTTEYCTQLDQHEIKLTLIDTLDFGERDTDVATYMDSFYIKNNGSVAAIIDSITFSGDGEFTFTIEFTKNPTLPYELLQGDSIKVKVKFAPVSGDMEDKTGDKLAILKIFSNSLKSPHSVVLKGKASVLFIHIPDPKFKAALLEHDIDTIPGGKIKVRVANAFAGVIEVEGRNIDSLTGIHYFTSITELNCADNNLDSLDITQNTALKSLACHNNFITHLDVSNNTHLTNLSCYRNDLTSLDVSSNTGLTMLKCDNNRLDNLDVSNNTALMNLHCHCNQLDSLDVNQNTGLVQLYCYDNRLTALNLDKNLHLSELNCHDNRLSVLNLDSNTALIELECQDNRLSVLNLDNNGALCKLNCRDNRLNTLSIANGNNDNMIYMYAERNPYISCIRIDNNYSPHSLWRRDSDVSYCTIGEQLAESDSLALVALYNSTNGDNWTNAWNLQDAVSTWYGVTINNQRRVTEVRLMNNRLSGTIPKELCNISTLRELNFTNNKLTDSVPSSLVNLEKLKRLYLRNNQLTHLPDLSGLAFLNNLAFRKNYLDFGDILPNKGKIHYDYHYSPQREVREGQRSEVKLGGSLALSVEVDGAGNTYQWFKNATDTIEGATHDTLILANMQFSDSGYYHCQINNPDLPLLTLRSGMDTVVITTTSSSFTLPHSGRRISSPERELEELQDFEVAIYPNPAVDHIAMSVSGLEEGNRFSYRLYDSFGKMLLSGNNLEPASVYRLELVDIAIGLHILEIVTQSGKMEHIKVLIE